MSRKRPEFLSFGTHSAHRRACLNRIKPQPRRERGVLVSASQEKVARPTALTETRWETRPVQVRVPAEATWAEPEVLAEELLAEGAQRLSATATLGPAQISVPARTAGQEMTSAKW